MKTGGVGIFRPRHRGLVSNSDLPDGDRVKMRTTNLTDRVFRKVRRRTRRMNYFANRRSMDRMPYDIQTRQDKLRKEGQTPNSIHSPLRSQYHPIRRVGANGIFVGGLGPRQGIWKNEVTKRL